TDRSADVGLPPPGPGQTAALTLLRPSTAGSQAPVVSMATFLHNAEMGGMTLDEVEASLASPVITTPPSMVRPGTAVSRAEAVDTEKEDEAAVSPPTTATGFMGRVVAGMSMSRLFGPRSPASPSSAAAAATEAADSAEPTAEVETAAAESLKQEHAAEEAIATAAAAKKAQPDLGNSLEV
ncbi:unnamed protein product, partial [Ectocarpus sp. 13 AM-2016]